jgi:hypothetical protein
MLFFIVSLFVASLLSLKGVVESLRKKTQEFLQNSGILETFEKSSKPLPDTQIIFNKLLQAIQRYRGY